MNFLAFRHDKLSESFGDDKSHLPVNHRVKQVVTSKRDGLLHRCCMHDRL